MSSMSQPVIPTKLAARAGRKSFARMRCPRLKGYETPLWFVPSAGWDQPDHAEVHRKRAVFPRSGPGRGRRDFDDILRRLRQIGLYQEKTGTVQNLVGHRASIRGQGHLNGLALLEMQRMCEASHAQ